MGPFCERGVPFFRIFHGRCQLFQELIVWPPEARRCSSQRRSIAIEALGCFIPEVHHTFLDGSLLGAEAESR